MSDENDRNVLVVRKRRSSNIMAAIIASVVVIALIVVLFLAFGEGADQSDDGGVEVPTTITQEDG